MHEGIFEDAQLCGDHGILASKSFSNVEVKHTIKV
jgi:hypothetical protein